ncbi:MAG: patatin-like phospholipase family protein, partial [Peptococcaceae bacterium]|nr:patatin-like phospholipase family protein [Peptococcaceae bacterium]
MQHFIPNTALICEGGGMRAVYTGGMASVMLEAGIKFPYVTGVSAGTTIAVNYVMQNIERMRTGFIDLSSDPNNVGLKPLLRGEGYFNSFSIYEEAFYNEEGMEENWRIFHDSGVEIALSAFNQDTGEIRYWHQADISSYRDLMRICRASSSLPMMMPPTYI